jgi:hypothetical protein
MTKLNEPLNPNEVRPLAGGKYLPVGSYSGYIESSVLKDTQAKNGAQYIELTIKCADNGFEGYTSRDIVNVRNQNPKAVEIGRSKLSSYCHAAGMMDLLEDTSQLFGLRFCFDVVQQKDSERTEVLFVRALEDVQKQPAILPDTVPVAGWLNPQPPVQASPAGWPQAQPQLQAQPAEAPAQPAASLPWRN